MEGLGLQLVGFTGYRSAIGFRGKVGVWGLGDYTKGSQVSMNRNCVIVL